MLSNRIGVAIAAFAFILASDVCLAQQSTSSAARGENSRPDAVSSCKVKSPSYLALERALRKKYPQINDGLSISREYLKRLPAHWGGLELTERQTKNLYSIQKEYFDEISMLEARIARLESERYARMRAILTDEQRATLDDIIKNGGTGRQAKKSPSKKETGGDKNTKNEKTKK